MKEKEIKASHLSTRLEFIALELKYNAEKNKSQMIKDLNLKFKKEIIKSREELKVIKKQNHQLLNENSIDELTQIYNRRGIRKLLDQKNEQLENNRFAIYIIDIDYFKKYNDFHGHIQGDKCLKIIANNLKVLDFEDYFIGRFGGEEFLCFAKVKDLYEAKEIAETIRKKISQLKMVYKTNGETKYITVSVGGKISESIVYEIKELISFADVELYKAKNSGRNQISVS